MCGAGGGLAWARLAEAPHRLRLLLLAFPGLECALVLLTMPLLSLPRQLRASRSFHFKNGFLTGKERRENVGTVRGILISQLATRLLRAYTCRSVASLHSQRMYSHETRERFAE